MTLPRDARREAFPGVPRKVIARVLKKGAGSCRIFTGCSMWVEIGSYLCVFLVASFPLVGDT